VLHTAQSGLNPNTSGPPWYCDAVAVNHREQTIYLSEITYARSLGRLQQRLASWNTHWNGVKAALMRDCSLPPWPVCPWVFIPEALVPAFEAKTDRICSLSGQDPMPRPRVTALENVLPWKYRSWDRQPDLEPPVPMTGASL
jgi:hypothetical protein